jgi:hypothetical protein
LLASVPGAAARIALTFTTVSLAWIFFRATTFAGAATMFQRMFSAHTGMGLPMSKQSLIVLAGVVFFSHVMALSGGWKIASIRIPAPLLGVSYAVVLTLALVLSPDSGKAFIYFQF